MKVDGQCLCKHITYQATVSPEQVYVCDCEDCKTHSGTPKGVVVGISGEEFKLQSGTLAAFKNTAANGSEWELTFCPECGTRIHAKHIGEGSGFFGLRAGTVNQREQLKPMLKTFCYSSQK